MSAASWISPIVTGVVGAVGIAGTYWTAKSGREAAAVEAEAQREHAVTQRVRDEKREVYVGYLAAVQEVRHRWREVRYEPSDSEGARPSAVAALTRLESEQRVLRMVASEQVFVAAKLFFADAERALDDALEQGPDGEPPDLEISRSLTNAMRQDLGYGEALSVATDTDDAGSPLDEP